MKAGAKSCGRSYGGKLMRRWSFWWRARLVLGRSTRVYNLVRGPDVHNQGGKDRAMLRVPEFQPRVSLDET